jgi:hypothetical protein
MDNEYTLKLINAMKIATDNFKKGFASSTLIGWLQEYDLEGRITTADPNFKMGFITIDTTKYTFIKRRWLVKVWNVDVDYNQFNKIEPLFEIDLTPDYLKKENT